MGRHDAALANNNAKRARASGDEQPKKSNKAHVGWKNPSMVRYLNESRWVTNKIRKVVKHAWHHPEDQQAFAWLKANTSTKEFNALVTRFGERWLDQMAKAGEG